MLLSDRPIICKRGSLLLLAVHKEASSYPGDFRRCGQENGRASAGQLLASENTEGPTLLPGPLNFQLTDAITLLTAANGRVVSSAAKDLNGDGHPETILTLASLRPTTTPSQPIIIESSARLRLATSDFLSGWTANCQRLPDDFICGHQRRRFGRHVIRRGGFGCAPVAGSAIGIGLNLGNGTYRNLQPQIPADQQTTRSYAIAAGDVLSDGHTQVVLPDENDGSNTALLRWNGNGFDETRNWVPLSLWRDSPSYLHTQSWMVLSDFDQDGKEDFWSPARVTIRTFRSCLAAAAALPHPHWSCYRMDRGDTRRTRQPH